MTERSCGSTTAQIVPLRPALAELRDDWVRLFGGDRFEPCVSYAWTAALVANQLRDHADLWIVVLRRAGHVHGIVPLMRDRTLVGGVPVRTLRPVAERSPTHSDLLIAGHDDAAVEAWLGALLGMPGWHELRLARLLAGERLAAALKSALGRLGCRFRLGQEAPSFFVTLPGDYSHYLAARSGKFRSHLRRMERRLSALGRLKLAVGRAPEDVEPLYRALLEIEARSWKFGHGTSIAGQPHQRGFYHELCNSAARAGILHCSVLFLDDRPVAHNLGLLDKGRYYYLKTSFDAEHKHLGPATVARAWLIRSLIEEGAREMDFPAEPYEWEGQWADELRGHEALVAYPPSVFSSALSLLHACKDRFTGRNGRMWAYADPRSHTRAGQ